MSLLVGSMFLAAGIAVDVGRWLQARSQTQAALSAAALAGGRMLQISGGDRQLAVGSARQAFLQNIDGVGLTLDGLSLVAGEDGSTFSANATGSIETHLLGVIGIRRLSLAVRPSSGLSATAGAARAVSGASGGTSYEVAIAVDMSARMSGAWLDSLKAALRDFIDIVVWSEQQPASSRVGLVPFGQAVVPGPAIEAFTGPLRAGDCAGPGCQRQVFRRRAAGCLATSGTEPDALCTQTFAAGHCVADRAGSLAYSDAPPALAALTPAYPNANGACDVGGEVVPLSPDKPALYRVVDALTATGASAPHLGAAWAWYLLSPEWGYLWPTASRPAPHPAPVSGRTRPALRKIAILVQSSGETIQHCRGIDDRLIDCAAAGGRAARQLREMCGAMRRSGISIFVIGVEVDGQRELEASLKDHCAGQDRNYYGVQSGRQLREAFRDLALQISPLVETQ